MQFSSHWALCIDTGASCSISNNKSDFSKLTTPPFPTVLNGISSGQTIHGTGTLSWALLADQGNEITLKLHNFLYVSDAPMCLLSPQHMAQQTSNAMDGFNSTSHFGMLTFSGKHTIYYNKNNNLPIIFFGHEHLCIILFKP
jgi:hypothetical protein